MLLRAFEAESDRKVCDRLGFDLRWRSAVGVDTGAEAFHQTVFPRPDRGTAHGHLSVGRGISRTARSRPPRPVHEGANAACFDSTRIHAVATEDGVIRLRAPSEG
jgi:hypothetical protein